MAFYALKPCTFAGQGFKIGDTIPEDLVLPGAIRRLKTEGVIAESEAGSLLPASASLDKEVEIPIIAEDGNLSIKMTAEQLVQAVIIAQMPEDDIIAQLGTVETEEQLILIDALAKSEAVHEAAKMVVDLNNSIQNIEGHLVTEDLETMSINELRKLAKDMDLSAAGTKEELIERIAAVPVYAGPEEKEEEPTGGEE